MAVKEQTGKTKEDYCMPKTKQLLEQIKSGGFDDTFSKLYANDAGTILKQRERYSNAIHDFEKVFGHDRDVQIYSAPGRTEIGGNHTDHNNGVVMAASVNLDIIAVVSRNNENTIRLKSKGFGRIDTIELDKLNPIEAETSHSASLIRGVAAGVVEVGGKIGGFDAYSTSDVLRGSGLSSSAAFEVVVGAILRGEYNKNKENVLSQVELAKIGQYAENVFFGKPSGLMDQTACAVGGAITIDFRDPKKPVVNKEILDLARHGYALCISDTKGSHADLTPDYAAIRSEMEAVATFFGKKALREVDEEKFYSEMPKIRKKIGDRAIVRSIHFFNDSRRACQLREAVRRDDMDEFLRLINEGGHSSFEYNQNAYSIHRPEQQGISVGLAVSQKILGQRGACRLQGGGFAGTIQAFVPADILEKYCSAINNVFGENSCHVLNIRNYGAIEVTTSL